MTIPTVDVTVQLNAQDGTKLFGVVVTAELDRNESYLGEIVARKVTGTTDANGHVVLKCFPNAPAPTGLGTMGSRYHFTAAPRGSSRLDVFARVPNQACNLTDIRTAGTIPPLDDATRAALAAQGYAAQASASLVALEAAAAAAPDVAGLVLNPGPMILTWFNTLPTTLPGSPGVLWNNGGTLSKS